LFYRSHLLCLKLHFWLHTTESAEIITTSARYSLQKIRALTGTPGIALPLVYFLDNIATSGSLVVMFCAGPAGHLSQ
jgi:hypothetical protein